MTKGPANSKYLKKINRLSIINIIKDNEPISRQQLSQVTGLTPPAITGIIRELLDSGFVLETGLGQSQGGRKPIKLTFNSAAAHVIGIELTRFETVIGIADLKNDPSDIRTMNWDMSEPETGINLLVSEIERIIGQSDHEKKKFLGIGIAFPGLLNAKTGLVRRSVNLGPGWNNFPLKEVLERRLGMPVVTENNARASALAERWFGGGIGCKNLAYVNLGEGISAGVILDDRILQGSQGYAGQMGHIVIKEDGSLCNCGNRGCLEALCGAPALLRTAAAELTMVKNGDPLKHIFDVTGKVTLADILLCAKEPDSYAEKLLHEVGRLVGMAIADVVNLYNPEKVFLGGKVARGANVFIGTLKEVVLSHSFPEVAEVTEIVISKLEKNAAVVGACALAIQELLQSPESALLEVE
jgi:N-acetylglucosamine repressor